MKFFIDGRECSADEYLDRTNIVCEDGEFDEEEIDESTKLKLEMIEDILDIIEQNENEDGGNGGTGSGHGALRHRMAGCQRGMVYTRGKDSGHRRAGNIHNVIADKQGRQSEVKIVQHTQSTANLGSPLVFQTPQTDAGDRGKREFRSGKIRST